MKRNLASAYNETLTAIANCHKSGNAEWLDRWTDRINHLDKMMPSGSGLDSGVRLDIANSTPLKLVFIAPFHRMDENGSYDGWADFTLTFTPTFSGIDGDIVGSDDDHLADHVHEVIHSALTEEVNHEDTYPWARKSPAFPA
jgi:hypothetical protein